MGLHIAYLRGLIFDPEDGGNMSFLKVSKRLPDYMASRPRIVTAVKTSFSKKHFYPEDGSSMFHCQHRTHLQDCVWVWTLVHLDVEPLLWFITRFCIYCIC
jgi:hypothetical protein